MTISCIIPAWNLWETTRTCLHSLAEHSQGEDIQVIVVDNGSTDATREALAPLGELIHIPAEILPVFLVRIFSSSAAVSFVLDIFKEFGPDSMIGMMVSIMMSCTETVFYTITIYYMSVKVTKTRWTLPGAMVATVAGTIASVVITRMIL